MATATAKTAPTRPASGTEPTARALWHARRADHRGGARQMASVQRRLISLREKQNRKIMIRMRMYSSFGFGPRPSWPS
jgi:hypothetical protein